MGAHASSSNNSRLMAVGAVVLLLGVILVLLILRGSVGGQEPAPETVTTAQRDVEEVDEGDEDSQELVADEEASTARVPLPLDLDDGMEAVTVRAAFDRAVAALPAAGDRAAVYLVAPAGDDEPAPEDDARRLFDDVEVLGVIGPRPAANEGTLTVVLAVAADDVAALLPAARDGELWLTLLPGGEAEGGQ